MSLNNYMKLNTSAPVIIQTLSPRELNKLYKSYLKRIIFPSGNKNLKASYSNKINKHNNNSQKFKRDKLTAYTCHFNDRTTEFRCKRCIGRTEYQNNNRYASIIVPRARNTNFSGQVNISQLKENMRRAQITGSAQSTYQMKNQEPINNHNLRAFLGRRFNRENLTPEQQISMLVMQMQNGNEIVD